MYSYIGVRTLNVFMFHYWLYRWLF